MITRYLDDIATDIALDIRRAKRFTRGEAERVTPDPSALQSIRCELDGLNEHRFGGPWPMRDQIRYDRLCVRERKLLNAPGRSGP